MREIWKTVERDPRYEVSSFGRVRSYCRFGGPHFLKSARASHGYPTVVLGRAIGSKLVHVLVAEAFIGPKPFPGAEVLHKLADKNNGRSDNLEWGTRSKNNQDKKWQIEKRNGDYHPLSGWQATAIKVCLKAGESGVTLARRFGVSQSLISQIKHGRIHADA